MSLLRRVIGAVLRRVRLRQRLTLREVAERAGVSLAYLSEIERGRKEASSEVLAAICDALGLRLVDLLEEAREELTRLEPAVAPLLPRRPGGVPVPPAGLAPRRLGPVARHRPSPGPALRRVLDPCPAGGGRAASGSGRSRAAEKISAENPAWCRFRRRSFDALLRPGGNRPDRTAGEPGSRSRQQAEGADRCVSW